MTKATKTHTTNRLNQNTSQKSEISRYADEIASLRRLIMKIDDKGAHGQSVDSGGPRIVCFDSIDAEADDRMVVLEQAVSLLEPQTLDDVLSLAIVLVKQVDSLIDDCTDNELEPRIGPSREKTDADRYRYKRDRRRVERLNRAILGGLLKFASSPIPVDSFWTSTWVEETKTAGLELDRMPLKKWVEAGQSDQSSNISRARATISDSIVS